MKRQTKQTPTQIILTQGVNATTHAKAEKKKKKTCRGKKLGPLRVVDYAGLPFTALPRPLPRQYWLSELTTTSSQTFVSNVSFPFVEALPST